MMILHYHQIGTHCNVQCAVLQAGVGDPRVGRQHSVRATCHLDATASSGEGRVLRTTEGCYSRIVHAVQ